MIGGDNLALKKRAIRLLSLILFLFLSLFENYIKLDSPVNFDAKATASLITITNDLEKVTVLMLSDCKTSYKLKHISTYL